MLEVATDPNVPPLPPDVSVRQASAYFKALLRGDPEALAIIKTTVRETWDGWFPPGEKRQMKLPLTLPGICWPLHATVGHIAVTTPQITGHFNAGAGLDAIVVCDLVPAGKYRNGAARQWCRTHQVYWGTQADLADQSFSGKTRCKHHASLMGYVLYPEVFDPSVHHGASLAQETEHAEDAEDAENTGLLVLRARPDNGGALLARKAMALAIDCRNLPGLFHADIAQINLTPPAVQGYLQARRSGAPLGCIDCPRCHHPHLDLDEFAQEPHQRHYCGHCGHSATHSKEEMVSNPLARLAKYALRTPQRIERWF